MDPSDNPYVQEFDKALEGWTDNRFVSSEQIRVMAMFLMYLVNLGEDDGWAYDGHSWRESTYLGSLVVRATIDGVPSVVFTSAKSVVSGMSIFLRKMDADVLEWVPDKYRT